MKYLFWLLGLFAAAVALTAASHNAGYVLLVYPPFRVELSLILFVLLWVASLVLFYLLVRVTNALLNMPAHVREFRQRRAQEKSGALLDTVLRAYFAGRYAEAEQTAAQAIQQGEGSALYPIIAARAAHELHDDSKRDHYLASIADKAIGDETMRLVTSRWKN
jgi:HemY protein